MLIMKIPFFSSLVKNSRRAGTEFVIAIGNKGVHFARIKYVAGRPQVVTYDFQQLAGGKASGFTSMALEKMRKGVKTGDFQFSTLLAPGEYQLLQVDAPNVPEEELKAAVRWSVKDMLNFHADDATIDVLRIPSEQTVGERKKSLYVVAASNEVIKKRMQLFEQAHINLRVIDIPEMAQRNIAALYEQEGRALALLAFDETGGLLTFTSDGELYLARRIEISLGQLQDANETLRQQSLDRLELEVQRSIDHFDRQFKHLPVRRLLVSVPENVGLVERLGNSLDLPVERVKLSEVMDIDEAPVLVSDEAQVYALHALGAALRLEGSAS
jgi:MSHA biogenesis protein MshI